MVIGALAAQRGALQRSRKKVRPENMRYVCLFFKKNLLDTWCTSKSIANIKPNILVVSGKVKNSR